MSDQVSELRTLSASLDKDAFPCTAIKISEAADTIEFLQRENEELKRYVNEAERLFRMYGLSSPPRKGHEWPNTGGMGDE